MIVPQGLFPAGSPAVVAQLPGSLHDWLALLGRMHVIVIHFPIALLLMAALGEVWARFLRRPSGWTAATLTFGALGAAVSTTLGWMLVWFNGYGASSTFTLHQYLGTATAIVAATTAVFYWTISKGQARWWMTALILLTAAMVGLTGHLGGTLVHGDLLNP